MNKQLRIAQIGTFEVKNYGDNLFPLVLYSELSKRISNFKIDFFGPYGGYVDYGKFKFVINGLINTNPYKILSSYDSIIIGRGDLIRFDEANANLHYKGFVGELFSGNFRPLKSMLLYRPWWWAEKKPLIIWNAVGVIGKNWNKIRRISKSVDLMAVRDNKSKEQLLKNGIKNNILIIPDTAILIKEIIVDAKLFEYTEVFNNKYFFNPQTVKNKKILGFHINNRFLTNVMDLEGIAKKLINVSNDYNLQIFLIPIGICHGDLLLLKELNKLANNSFILINRCDSPLNIAAIISKCDFLISSSLHGNITASSFDIPHLAINTLKWQKLSGFLKIINREYMSCENWEDFNNKIQLLLSEKCYLSKDAVSLAKETVKNYFDLLAGTISKN